MNAKGTIVGNLAFKDSNDSYVRCGSIIYYRDHSGFSPSARIRIDMVPIKAWANGANNWMVATFNQSDKIREAPYIHGDIYTPSDIRGERTYVGKIITDESHNGSSVHYRATLDGLPLRELARTIKVSLLKSVDDIIKSHNGESGDKLIELIHDAFDKSSKSMYLSVEM